MRIVASPRELPAGQRVVALGTFDGVHLGHRRLIQTAVHEAGRRGLRSTVATFDPMPLEVLRPDQAPGRLTGIGRRASLVAEDGPDELLVLRFDRELSLRTPERFAAEVLVEQVRAAHVVIGEDFRFGHRAAGDAATLATLGGELGFDVTAIPLVLVDGERVSSSWIRELVGKGEVTHAARLLGRDPWLDGAVVRGEGRGKALGVPTANLAWPPGRIVPGRGIYAGYALVATPSGTERYGAAISVGANPTFGADRAVSVEAFLLDFDRDIYGSPLRLEFTRFLRHELRFDSVDELVAQMAQDIAQVRAIVAGEPPIGSRY
jgi:riboflavin kinase/FMN adenylyltransferase